MKREAPASRFRVDVNREQDLRKRLVLVPVAVILAPMAGGNVSAGRRVGVWAFGKSHQLGSL